MHRIIKKNLKHEPFKRHVHGFKSIKRMVIEFSKKLQDPAFFKSLPNLHGGGRVRLAEFNGKKVVIKNTRGSEVHGLNHEEITRIHRAHEIAAKKGIIDSSPYIWTAIKVYARIGNYLVMEYVPEKLPDKSNAMELFNASQELSAVESKLSENLLVLQKKGLIKMIPQIDVIKRGTRNGKLVFSLAVDFG